MYTRLCVSGPGSVVHWQIYLYILGFLGNISGFFCYINSLSFSDFALYGRWEGLMKGKRRAGRLTKILPARQTHFGKFFRQPFGENTFSQNALPPPPPQQNKLFLENKTLYRKSITMVCSLANILHFGNSCVDSVCYTIDHKCTLHQGTIFQKEGKESRKHFKDRVHQSVCLRIGYTVFRC